MFAGLKLSSLLQTIHLKSHRHNSAFLTMVSTPKGFKGESYWEKKRTAKTNNNQQPATSETIQTSGNNHFFENIEPAEVSFDIETNASTSSIDHNVSIEKIRVNQHPMQDFAGEEIVWDLVNMFSIGELISQNLLCSRCGNKSLGFSKKKRKDWCKSDPLLG